MSEVKVTRYLWQGHVFVLQNFFNLLFTIMFNSCGLYIKENIFQYLKGDEKFFIVSGCNCFSYNVTCTLYIKVKIQENIKIFLTVFQMKYFNINTFRTIVKTKQKRQKTFDEFFLLYPV